MMFEGLQAGLSTLRSTARRYGLIPPDPRTLKPAIGKQLRPPEAGGRAAPNTEKIDRSVEGMTNYRRQPGLTPIDPALGDGRRGVGGERRDRWSRDRDLSIDEEQAHRRRVYTSGRSYGDHDRSTGFDHEEEFDHHWAAASAHDDESKIADVYVEPNSAGDPRVQVAAHAPSGSALQQRIRAAIAAEHADDRERVQTIARRIASQDAPARQDPPRHVDRAKSPARGLDHRPRAARGR